MLQKHFKDSKKMLQRPRFQPIKKKRKNYREIPFEKKTHNKFLCIQKVRQAKLNI